MVLQFVCPNGHKIHCGEERAGMAARCPRCGARFRIPTLEQIRAGQLQARQADLPTAESVRTASPAGGGALAEIAVGPASTPDQIEFFCPNDHRLHGPASLQGQPGTCPECGAAFRIPSLDEWEEEVEEWQELEEEAPPEAVAPPLPPLSASPPRAEAAPPEPSVTIGPVSAEPAAPPGSPGAAAGPLAGPKPSSLAAASKPVAAPAPPPAASVEIAAPANTLRELLPALWEYKAQGASIEIQYGNGQRLHPDEFLAGLSAGSHAVFADRAADGSYTLSAVAWHAIVAVVVRGIQQLAPEHGG